MVARVLAVALSLRTLVERMRWAVLSIWATAGSAVALATTPFSLGKMITSLDAQSRQIPCPFFRKRAGDAVESLVGVAGFIAARHKSLGLPENLLPPRACGEKTVGLPLHAVMAVVARDIEDGQYYVGGKLSQEVYDDACFFDGPDPDMPVRSLGRYCDALRGLFDPRASAIELAAIEPHGASAFVAHWRISGALKLPWRPTIKPYAGCTLYECSPETGLIVSHTEAWSLSVLDAFLSTLWPSFGAPAAPPVEEGHLFVQPPPCRLAQPPQQQELHLGDTAAQHAPPAKPQTGS